MSFLTKCARVLVALTAWKVFLFYLVKYRLESCTLLDRNVIDAEDFRGRVDATLDGSDGKSYK